MRLRKEKIKVLQLVEDFKIGGLERVVASIYDGLDRDKYKINLWCIAEGGELADEFIKKQKDIRILNLKTYHNPLNILKLAYHIKREKYDIVHTHGYYASTMGRISAFLARTPIIVSHVHTTYWDFKVRHLKIEKALSQITDCIICCSKAVKEFMVFSEKIDQNRAIVIYNGVRCKKTEEKTESDRNDQKVVKMVVVANLVANKGHKNMLEALSVIIRKHKNVKLSILGDGPLRSKIEAYSKSLGLINHVDFLGTVRDVDMTLQNCDIVILPSIDREGLGMAIIEGMCMAKPVIGSKIGGIPELIENEINGYLVRPGDSEALAKKIKILIEDRDLSKRMGIIGRKIYEEKFDLSIMIKKIEDLYDSLLVKKGINIY